MYHWKFTMLNLEKRNKVIDYPTRVRTNATQNNSWAVLPLSYGVSCGELDNSLGHLMLR